MSFIKGFEKVALQHYALNAAIGGGIGALAGGKKDKHGHKTERGVEAARGAAVLTGATAVGPALRHPATRFLSSEALQNKKHYGKLVAATIAGTLGAQALGGYAGYKAMKHLGPQYSKDKK